VINSRNNALALLSVAASNILATHVHSAQVAEQFQFGVRHHNYQEDPLAEPLGGSPERYDINVNQFSLIAPLADSADLSVSYQKEKMSGASPWYTLKFGDEEPLQVMSGASIEDTRTDVSATLRVIDDFNSYGITAAVSEEDDYKSASFGFKYSRETEKRLSTWSIAADFSNDDINPVDADIYTTRPMDTQSKHSVSTLGSYSRILNKNTLLQLSVGLSKKSGYLSDPYKVVVTQQGLIGDARPDSKISKTIATQLRYFVDPMDAALHLDYRFYTDDWSIDSHTVDITWYQNLLYDVQLIPSIRLYSQSQSYFYDVFYKQERADNYYSTDYRLSEYGAVTLGLKLIKKFDSWSMTLSADKYSSSGDTFLANTDVENPALIDFTLVSFGFDLQF
jgi:hypothetical protein